MKNNSFLSFERRNYPNEGGDYTDYFYVNLAQVKHISPYKHTDGTFVARVYYTCGSMQEIDVSIKRNRDTFIDAGFKFLFDIEYEPDHKKLKEAAQKADFPYTRDENCEVV